MIMFYDKNSCKVFCIDIKIKSEVTLTDSAQQWWSLSNIVFKKHSSFWGQLKCQEYTLGRIHHKSDLVLNLTFFFHISAEDT